MLVGPMIRAITTLQLVLPAIPNVEDTLKRNLRCVVKGVDQSTTSDFDPKYLE